MLTKWGDITILGKRKPVPEPVEEDPEELIYEGDRISVLIDTDEFEDEEEEIQETARARVQTENLSSGEDSNSVNLGESAESTKNADSTIVHNIQGLSKEKQKLLNENPHFHSIMSKMLDARLKTLLPNDEMVPNPEKGKKGKSNHVNHDNLVRNVNMVKSPSDTTIYAPALMRQSHNNTSEGNNFEQRIVDFVGTVQRQQEMHEQDGGEGPSTRPNFQKENEILTEMQSTRCKAEGAIVEAEKFRASIAEPPGKYDAVESQDIVQCGQLFDKMDMQGNCGQNMIDCGQTNISQGSGDKNRILPDIGSGVGDDDLFHLTCFIEPSLIHKIEKGEFVELEKLLPKDRSSFNRGGGCENRLEWVQHDGSTYLVTAGGKEQKITGIRRWEQAFRVYATIYCAANPQRAKEIWQYIAVINTAASTYIWDNVYNYDITFRHLMAFNPNRSWAVTYNQMWNLSMKDLLPRNVSHNGRTVSVSPTGT